MSSVIRQPVVLFTNVNIDLPYDPGIPLLGVYSEELKASIQTKYCTGMPIALLFTIPKRWKQPVSINKWGISMQ